MTATMSAVDPAPSGAPAGRDSGQQRTSRPAIWGRILPIRVGQIAVWQLGALAVVAILPWSPGPTIGTLRPLHMAVIAAAALAFLATSFRIGGLCAYQWVAVYFGYRRHKMAKPAAKQTESNQKKAEQKPEADKSGKPAAANQGRGNPGNGAPGAPRLGGPASGNPHFGFPNPGIHKTGNTPSGNRPQWPGNPNPDVPLGRTAQRNTPSAGRPQPGGPNGNRPGNPANAHFGGPNPTGGGEFPDGDPLVALLPGLTTRRHIDRAGNRVGLANVDDGWTAVLRLASPGRPSPAALVSTMRSIHQRTDVPLSSVGLVVWTMPGPLHADSTDRAPKAEPIRVFWLAVRYRPSEAPLAALARGGDEIGAMRATASAAMRLAAELARVGLACSVLDEPELRQDLLIALGCDRASGSAINESWRTWTVGRIRQSCFGLRHSRDIVVALNRWAPGAAFSSTSLLISRNAHGKIRRDLTVRIGLPRNPMAKPERLASGLNIGLVPLHGRHARHVKASLPLALRG